MKSLVGPSLTHGFLMISSSAKKSEREDGEIFGLFKLNRDKGTKLNERQNTTFINTRVAFLLFANLIPFFDFLKMNVQRETPSSLLTTYPKEACMGA